MNTTTAEVPRPPAVERQGLVVWAAQKFGVEAGKVFPILKQTCFRGEIDRQTGVVKEATDAEVAALMIVAREHGLNPFLKEIYAFPDKRGGIVPVVGVDGWIRIVNEHPAYDGVEFIYEKFDGTPAWIECHMFRKDRSHPIEVREFLIECKRDTTPWKSHPARMLRHKTYIQCARLAFGFVGIYDDDEAERIIDGQVIETAQQQAPQRGAAALKSKLVGDGINLEPTATSTAGSGSGPGAYGSNAPEGGSAGGAARAAGTIEQRDAFIKKFGECKDTEILALVRDEARMYAWTAADQEVLDVAYSKRQDDLERG